MPDRQSDPLAEIRSGATLVGPLTPGGAKYRWFAEYVGNRKRNGDVHVRLIALMPGVGGTLMKSTVTCDFPEGRAGGEWRVVDPDEPAEESGLNLTAEQVGILNSLVTFAVEELDSLGGGLQRAREPVADDERAVAKIVGQWALRGATAVPGIPA